MQIDIQAKPARIIASIRPSENGCGIAVDCPVCKTEIEFYGEWPIEIPQTCGNSTDGILCSCRFIIMNDTPIVE